MNRVSSCLSNYSARVGDCLSQNRALLKTAAKVTLSAAGLIGGCFIPDPAAQGALIGVSGIALFQSVLSHNADLQRSWKQIAAGSLFSGFIAAKAFSKGELPHLLWAWMGGMGVVYGDLLLDFCCDIHCPEGMYNPPSENVENSEEPLRGDGALYDVNDPY